MKLTLTQPSRLLLLLTRGVAITALMLLSACQNFPSIATDIPATQESAPASEPTPAGPPQAEVVFDVQVPEGTSAEDQVTINILDEVTGLAFNTTSYPMQSSGNGHYQIRLGVPVGSLVKYRYTREGSASAVEYNTHGQQTRYRLLLVDNAIVMQDIISAWSDNPFPGATGRVSGTVTDSATGRGIPNLMVNAGGAQTFTSADGTFQLEGLVPGTHNLVLYSLDGSYRPFQQGATIAAGATTPAPVSLSAAPLVNITFVVSVPNENVIGVPVRLAGNLYQTGNVFADLAGGMNSTASRMPLMTMGPDGRYSLTLLLPAGTDLRYKYTLGDGFWNAEHSQDGAFQVRQLIVPSQDTTVTDSVFSWRAGDFAPVTLNVSVPADTPVTDYISVQFNPFAWTEPIPMWALGENQWMYVLYSPLNLTEEIGVRYCRNDQCGSADDAATQGEDNAIRRFSGRQEPQQFQDTVESWAWWSAIDTPTTVMAADVEDRGESFFAGIEFQPGYHPSWQNRYAPVLQNLKSIGASWTVFTPSWTFTRAEPPVLEPVPGLDALWFDLIPVIGQSNGQEMSAAIFPQVRIPGDANEWWQGAEKDSAWWEMWFTDYERFLLYHADLATQSGAKAMVLGGEWITPALPNGVLGDGSSSGVPTNADARWQEIIENVRNRYEGQVLWALPYLEQMSPPAILDSVDGIYLLVDSSLLETDTPTEPELEEAIGTLLDTYIAPLRESTGIPIVLAISYPSANGSARSCVLEIEGQCLKPDLLARPLADLPSVEVDLQEQVDIYNAFFSQVNQREWINGVVSRGFYMPAALQDKSASVHGKPAFDILWYWFPRLTGQQAQ